MKAAVPKGGHLDVSHGADKLDENSSLGTGKALDNLLDSPIDIQWILSIDALHLGETVVNQSVRTNLPKNSF